MATKKPAGSASAAEMAQRVITMMDDSDPSTRTANAADEDASETLERWPSSSQAKTQLIDKPASVIADQAYQYGQDNPSAAFSDDRIEDKDIASDEARQTVDKSNATNQPPDYWSDTAKNDFVNLPKMLQQQILGDETTRINHYAAAHNNLADALGSMLESQALYDPVLKDGQATDWAGLSQSDPALYQQKSQAFNSRVKAYQTADAVRKTVHERGVAERVAGEHRSLAAKLPEWSDPIKRQAMLNEVRKAAPAWGFDPNQMEPVQDHRLVLMALDAAAHRNAQDNKAQAGQALKLKKLVNLPRLEPPGGSGSDDSHDTKLNRLKSRALKSNRISDQAAYILNALK